MICCLDVDYREGQGQCAAVLFREWDAATAEKVYRSVTGDIKPYTPGTFYKRELPCMLDMLRLIEEPVGALLIDGYVWLGENRGGLGYHLFEALEKSVPVIGVAKSAFRGAERMAISVFRGASHQPLWVTAIGMDTAEAAHCIAQMSGEFRIPTLLKMADRQCRQWDNG